VQRKLLGEFYDQHYRKWLDEPVPALGNRAPGRALEDRAPQVDRAVEGFRKPLRDRGDDPQNRLTF
jgi:hypothetical protein